MGQDERPPANDTERLEAISEVLGRLSELACGYVILVEGKNDKVALNGLGIEGDFFLIQSGGGPVRAVEYVESHGGKCVILTDFDRRGRMLAEQLASMLHPGPDTDLRIRSELRRLCTGYIHDVESLCSFVKGLQSNI